MVVFEYEVGSIEDCWYLLEGMNLPGEKSGEELNPNQKVAWKGSKFIGLFYPDENKMELYGTKNTNSVKFYETKYPKLEYDNVSIIKTKRW